MLVYEQGRIIAQGTPLEVLGAPRTLSVANLAGLENIFIGRIAARHTEGGTMSVQIGAITIETPDNGQAVGETVNIAISARDILLAALEPRATSARNILTGQVSQLLPRELNYYVTVDCGIPFSVLITRQAAVELAITVGARVWLAFKAHSCHLLS